MSLAPDDPRHGTYNGYHNLRCRCSPCTKAHTDYLRASRHRQGAIPQAIYLRMIAGTRAPHGSVSRYGYGCRCKACKRASANARAAHRLANLEATRAYDRARKRRTRTPEPVSSEAASPREEKRQSVG